MFIGIYSRYFNHWMIFKLPSLAEIIFLLESMGISWRAIGKKCAEVFLNFSLENQCRKKINTTINIYIERRIDWYIYLQNWTDGSGSKFGWKFKNGIFAYKFENKVPLFSCFQWSRRQGAHQKCSLGYTQDISTII